MARHKVIFFLFASLLAMPSLAIAQASYNEIVYQRMRAISPSLLASIKERLPATEVTSLDNLHFRFDRRGLTNASARLGGPTGRSEITIYTGIVLAIDLIAQSVLVHNNYPDCSERYLQYMYNQYYKKTDRSLRGLSIDRMLTPPGFFLETPSCQGAFRLIMNPPPQMGQLYVEFVEASVTLLFLHELAHLHLRHTATDDLELSRKQEADADEWALKRLPLLYSDVGAALPLMLHIALTNGESLEDERRMSHPLGIRRFVNVLDRTIPTITDKRVADRMLRTRDKLLELIQ